MLQHLGKAHGYGAYYTKAETIYAENDARKCEMDTLSKISITLLLMSSETCGMNIVLEICWYILGIFGFGPAKMGLHNICSFLASTALKPELRSEVRETRSYKRETTCF